MAENLETVNVRLPEELLKIIDQLVDRGIFSSRSEAIRDFCREYAHEASNEVHVRG